ncbi:unnamed protein product [Paramecium sonneborni]|uniref:Uncharacterized protein n=1 Tax=Paramecium sonneborni TaxID=65129 RepID=A0A8S1LW88_9CILI|nr:unnamed protein product [Paramecium sonneborni]
MAKIKIEAFFLLIYLSSNEIIIKTKVLQGFSLSDNSRELLTHLKKMSETNVQNSFLDFSQIEQESEPRKFQKIKKNPKVNTFIHLKPALKQEENKSCQEIIIQNVPHSKLLEFLEIHHYSYMYEYVKCQNKRFNNAIKSPQKSQIYNYQMKEINDENYNQRSIENLVDQLQITNQQDFHKIINGNLIKVYDLEEIKYTESKL